MFRLIFALWVFHSLSLMPSFCADAAGRVTSRPPNQSVNKAEANKRRVADLFTKAVRAFTEKRYGDAISVAQEIQRIEIKGDTQYKDDAQRIIDRARRMQNEEYGPFLIQARQKQAEGDYKGAKDLCEEIHQRDPANEDAMKCLSEAKESLRRNRLEKNPLFESQPHDIKGYDRND